MGASNSRDDRNMRDTSYSRDNRDANNSRDKGTSVTLTETI